MKVEETTIKKPRKRTPKAQVELRQENLRLWNENHQLKLQLEETTEALYKHQVKLDFSVTAGRALKDRAEEIITMLDMQRWRRQQNNANNPQETSD